MASSLALKIATVTSTTTFAKTDAEMAQILRWFIAGWADAEPTDLTPTQLNQWRLDQANKRIVDYVRQTAQQNRLKELRSQQTSIEDTATADTAI